MLVDAFSPSHLLYLKRRALNTYNAGIVECFSPKVAKYLLEDEEDPVERGCIMERTMPKSKEEVRARDEEGLERACR